MCSFAEWVYLYMTSTCWTVSQFYLLPELQKSHDGGVTAGIGSSVSAELRVHFFFPPPENKKPAKVGESELSAYLL